MTDRKQANLSLILICSAVQINARAFVTFSGKFALLIQGILQPPFDKRAPGLPPNSLRESTADRDRVSDGNRA